MTATQALRIVEKKTRAIQAALGFSGEQIDGDYGPLTTSRRALLERTAETDPDIEWAPDAPSAPGKINADGLALVQHFEGLYLTAYQDEVGIWTIGYGHTGLSHNDGTVYHGRAIGNAEALELLRYDMGVFERRASGAVEVDVSGNEFAALVSFDFNTGGLLRSTLLRKLNADDRQGAADEFLRWNRAGGQVLSGLTRRRKSERNLFLSVRPYIIT